MIYGANTVLMLLLAATLASAQMTVTLPWTTFSAAAEQSGRGGELGMCASGGEVYRARLVHDKNAYGYLYAPETQRIMFMVWVGDNEGATADAIGIGTVGEVADVIPPLEWMTVAEAQARWPRGPCGWLYPDAA